MTTCFSLRHACLECASFDDALDDIECASYINMSIVSEPFSTCLVSHWHGTQNTWT